EHRVDADSVADKQVAVGDAGYIGLLAEAVPDENGGAGAIGRLAVLAHHRLPIAASPGAASHVLAPGRVVAAHIHSFRPGGIVFMSAYFKDSVGMGPQSANIFWLFVEFLARPNGQWAPWIVGAGWGAQPAELFQADWAQAI
ncbi:unnamed protein product, partial [Prorocentrum cordatum]